MNGCLGKRQLENELFTLISEDFKIVKWTFYRYLSIWASFLNYAGILLMRRFYGVKNKQIRCPNGEKVKYIPNNINDEWFC